MDNVDRDKLREVVEGSAIVAIHRQHGERGTRSFRDLSVAIRKLFLHVEPEVITSVIVVFKSLDDRSRPLPEKGAATIVNPANLSQKEVANSVIQVLADGRFLLWRNIQIDIKSVAEGAVVYRYFNRVEHFFAGNAESEIAKVGQYASIYSVPAFSDLRQAIERYRSDMAKESSCEILQKAWADPNRIVFRNGPEPIMRSSLLQFLKVVLRDAEPRPEQIVDASHPVDIKVTFSFSNRLAVIEIKWVGNSVGPSGKMVKWRDGRARTGARQLADYLNKNKQQAPTHITRGYLVVFDARRRGIKKGLTKLSLSDGGYYRHQELVFDPRYEHQRDDFEAPIRIFLEPVCL